MRYIAYMRYLFGFLNLVASAIVGATAVLVGGMACDESCNPGSGDWSDSPDSWQWDAIVWLGLGLFALGVILFVFAGAKWVVPAVTFFAGQVVLWLLFFSLASGAESFNLLLPLIFAAFQLGLAGATVLETRGARAQAEHLT